MNKEQRTGTRTRRKQKRKQRTVNEKAKNKNKERKRKRKRKKMDIKKETRTRTRPRTKRKKRKTKQNEKFLTSGQPLSETDSSAEAIHQGNRTRASSQKTTEKRHKIDNKPIERETFLCQMDFHVCLRIFIGLYKL